MSSRTSRRMGLRGLVLGGAVSGLSTLSSCVAALGASLLAYNKANNDKIQADRENAKMIAGANSDPSHYMTFYHNATQQEVTVYIRPGEENIPLGEIYNRRMREINPNYIPCPEKPIVTIPEVTVVPVKK